MILYLTISYNSIKHKICNTIYRQCKHTMYASKLHSCYNCRIMIPCLSAISSRDNNLDHVTFVPDSTRRRFVIVYLYAAHGCHQFVLNV